MTRNRGWRHRHDGPVRAVSTAIPGVTAYVPRDDCVTYGNPVDGHVVLLGDSILDNEHYTGGAPDVSQRLTAMLGDGWAVSLVARDGATTRSLPYQFQHVPVDTTHLVISIGGNDANGESRILRDAEQRTMRDSLDELWFMGELFSANYAAAVTPLLGLGVPVVLCTIYDCDFPPGEREPVKAALAIFNDVILRFAFVHDVNVLDLRTVCTEPEDYEHIIEPSAVGGTKIAKAIAERTVNGYTNIDYTVVRDPS